MLDTESASWVDVDDDYGSVWSLDSHAMGASYAEIAQLLGHTGLRPTKKKSQERREERPGQVKATATKPEKQTSICSYEVNCGSSQKFNYRAKKNIDKHGRNGTSYKYMGGWFFQDTDFCLRRKGASVSQFDLDHWERLGSLIETGHRFKNFTRSYSNTMSLNRNGSWNLIEELEAGAISKKVEKGTNGKTCTETSYFFPAVGHVKFSYTPAAPAEAPSMNTVYQLLSGNATKVRVKPLGNLRNKNLPLKIQDSNAKGRLQIVELMATRSVPKISRTGFKGPKHASCRSTGCSNYFAPSKKATGKKREFLELDFGTTVTVSAISFAGRVPRTTCFPTTEFLASHGKAFRYNGPKYTIITENRPSEPRYFEKIEVYYRVNKKWVLGGILSGPKDNFDEVAHFTAEKLNCNDVDSIVCQYMRFAPVRGQNDMSWDNRGLRVSAYGQHPRKKHVKSDVNEENLVEYTVTLRNHPKRRNQARKSGPSDRDYWSDRRSKRSGRSKKVFDA